MTCEGFYYTAGPAYDIADNAVWEPLLRRIKSGMYHGLFAVPPADTFSKVRGDPGELPALRGTEGAD